MDKKLKWSIIISAIILFAVSSSIVLYYVIENHRLIDEEGIKEIHPTPNAKINVTHEIVETQYQDYFLYEFIITFDIINGIDTEFYYLDKLFNSTQMYILIKANHGLEFYSVVQIVNMTEFYNDSSQVVYFQELETPVRFENLLLTIKQGSISADGNTFIGGGYHLYGKEQDIYVENVNEFSGILHFWINENNYTLGYQIFSNRSLFYTINSTIGDLELYISQITILGWTGTHGYQIGSLYFPHAPKPPGTYSESFNLTLTSNYESLSFSLLAGISFIYAEIEFDIKPS